MAELISRVVQVGTASTVLSEKKSRHGFLHIENKGATAMEIVFGEQAAVVGQGINIAAGASKTFTDPCAGRISAITITAPINVTVTD